MKYLSRVVWSEGMYLGPHHFQVQSRYFEDSIRFATNSLWFEAWGLIGCTLDAEALRNGTVSVIHARGVFPDGLSFNMKESDPLPPARKQNGLNCVDAEAGTSPSVRYVAETNLLHDEISGIDEKPVRLGRKNIRLLLDTEAA